MSEWGTSVLHADLDAFYASVEVLRDPSLKGKPVIVGGTSSRGVVTSASYEAREYGVRSAMPTSRARRLCPHGIFVSPDFSAYTEKSREVRRVFDSFSPVVEPLSLDEAFIDLTGARRMWPNPGTIAEALRGRVRRETGLVVSVGLAPNKFLAKIASDQAKPDGVIIVRPWQIRDFLDPLSVSALWGVGGETAAVLERLGLRTIGDVVSVPTPTLERALGSLGNHIAQLARGRDDRKVVADAARKSVSAEETFEYDLVEEIQIFQAILKLADRVSSRLRAQGISGHTVTIKVRFSNFVTVTRSKTVPHEIDGATSIYAVARELFERAITSGEAGRRRIRLMGIGLSNLMEWPASQQLTFERRADWGTADKALDMVRQRFGDDALEFGSLLEDF